MDRVLLIDGPKFSGIKQPIRKAKALGLEVLYIQQKDQFEYPDLAYVDQLVLVDYQKDDENAAALVPIAEGLFKAFPFGYVYSSSESGLIPAAKLNNLFGLPGNSLGSVRLLKDKWAMRQRLNTLNVSPVAARIGQTLADIFAFARDCGFPIIVKPADLSGSLGIFRIDEPDNLEPAWQQIQEMCLSRFIMEEYLDGREISVEAFSFGGHHVILALTDKLILPNFVEIGHSIPAQLDSATQAQVMDTVISFLDVVGLREGPSHTEVKLTSRGPRIVESHNRRGGDRINELVQVAYGVDMESLALAWPFGLADVLYEPPPFRAGAAIRFFAPPPGVVREISGLRELRDSEEVVEAELKVEIGSQVRPVKWSHDRSGYLLTKGADAQEAIDACERLAQKIHVVTE